MRPRNRSFAIAGATALSALGAFAFAWYFLSSLPSDPPGDGFAVGLAAGFGLGIGLSGALLALDALVLTVAELFELPGPRQRLVLQVGCAAGALGIPCVVGFELTTVPELAGAWLVLVVAGTAVTSLGALGTFVDRGARSLSRA